MPSYKDKLPIQTTINFDTIPTIGSTNAVTSGGIYNSLLSKQDVLTNPVTGTGTAGQVAYFNGTSAVTGSANLFWDNANGRLGVGTASPTVQFEVQNSARIRGGLNINGVIINSSTGVVDLSTLLVNANVNAVGIGTTTTVPSARLHVRGSGTTSATTALLVQNNDATPARLMSVTDDGRIYIGTQTDTQAPYFAGYTGFAEFGAIQRTLGIRTQFPSLNRPQPGVLIGNSINFDYITNTGNYFVISINFSPTSGTGILNTSVISPTINQTGGANGITRGLYVNPVLTAAADWRSIETSNNTGYAVYASGTANSYFGGNVGIGTTSPTHSLHNAGNSRFQSIIIGAAASTAISNTSQDVALNIASSSIGIGGFTTFTPSARLHVRGSGTTSATTALLVQNSTPSELFKVLDNGSVFASNDVNLGTSSTFVISNNSGGTNVKKISAYWNGTSYGIDIETNRSTDSTVGSGYGVRIFNPFQYSYTTSTFTSLILGGANFSPASGTGVFNSLQISYTINQTGGASGITRGLYVNPTLTAAADWRGIESVAASNANHTLLKLRNATVDVFTVKSDSKIGFFNATPVAQPTTAIAEAAFVENSGGTAVNVDSTFAGYTIQQIAQALKDIGILA